MLTRLWLLLSVPWFAFYLVASHNVGGEGWRADDVLVWGWEPSIACEWYDQLAHDKQHQWVWEWTLIPCLASTLCTGSEPCQNTTT